MLQSTFILIISAAFCCLLGCDDATETEQSSVDQGSETAAVDMNSLDMNSLDMNSLDMNSLDMNSGDAQLSEPTGAMISAKDLAYPPPAGVDSDLAFLDVFRMDDGQTRPLVLLVHGGSWVGGDKAGFESKIVPWWVDKGYVAAPINFRLASRLNQPLVVSPREQARDIAAGLAWLISQAETYQIDPENIVILGYSSGAHLVALLGTDETILREAGVNEAHVKGTISFDVHAYDVPYALELMVDSVVEQNMPLIRHLFGDTEEAQLASSPINFVDGWVAPSLIISVDEDPEVAGTHGYIVSKVAERYQEALSAAGHQVNTFHDTQETHSSLVNGFGEPDDLVTEQVSRFLELLNP